MPKFVPPSSPTASPLSDRPLPAVPEIQVREAQREADRMQEVMLLLQYMFQREDATIKLIINCLYDVGTTNLINQKVRPRPINRFAKWAAKPSKPVARMLAMRWFQKNCPELITNWLYTKVSFGQSAAQALAAAQHIQPEADESLSPVESTIATVAEGEIETAKTGATVAKAVETTTQPETTQPDTTQPNTIQLDTAIAPAPAGAPAAGSLPPESSSDRSAPTTRTKSPLPTAFPADPVPPHGVALGTDDEILSPPPLIQGRYFQADPSIPSASTPASIDRSTASALVPSNRSLDCSSEVVRLQNQVRWLTALLIGVTVSLGSTVLWLTSRSQFEPAAMPNQVHATTDVNQPKAE